MVVTVNGLSEGGRGGSEVIMYCKSQKYSDTCKNCLKLSLKLSNAVLT